MMSLAIEERGTLDADEIRLAHCGSKIAITFCREGNELLTIWSPELGAGDVYSIPGIKVAVPYVLSER
jgi:hypothetical protein